MHKWAFIEVLSGLRRNSSLKGISDYIYYYVNPKESLDFFKNIGVDIYSLLDKNCLNFISLYDKLIKLVSLNYNFRSIKLIDWYNGDLKTEFEKYTHDINKITSLLAEMESLFISFSIDKKTIDTFDFV